MCAYMVEIDSNYTAYWTYTATPWIWSQNQTNVAPTYICGSLPVACAFNNKYLRQNYSARPRVNHMTGGSLLRFIRPFIHRQ